MIEYSKVDTYLAAGNGRCHCETSSKYVEQPSKILINVEL